MAAVAAYSFCDERGKAPLISVCFQPPVTPCGFPVPVSHLFPAGPPPPTYLWTLAYRRVPPG